HPARLAEAAATFLTIAESTAVDIQALFAEPEKKTHAQIDAKLCILQRRIKDVQGMAKRADSKKIAGTFAAYESAIASKRTPLEQAAIDPAQLDPDRRLGDAFNDLYSTVEQIRARATRRTRINTFLIYAATVSVSWFGSWLFAGSIATRLHERVVGSIVDGLPV